MSQYFSFLYLFIYLFVLGNLYNDYTDFDGTLASDIADITMS